MPLVTEFEDLVIWKQARKQVNNFLRIAKASCGEVRSMLYLAEDRRFLSPEDADVARAFARQLSKSIAAFRRTL